jgi:hypothetical protein
MQELVEMIRRDHARLSDLADAGDDDAYGAVLEAHRTLLEGTIAVLVEPLGVNAVDEWEEARGLLDEAESDRSALRGHAEQMEQVVLPRLLSEVGQEDLSEATVEVMRQHEALGLGSSGPSAMRASIDEDAEDTSRPAGA